MFKCLSLSLLPIVLTLATGLTQAQPADQANLNLSFKQGDHQTQVITDLVVPGVSRFFLLASAGRQFDFASSVLLGTGWRFDENRSRLVAFVSNSIDLGQLDVTLAAAYRDPASGAIVFSLDAHLGIGSGLCEKLSFEFDTESNALPAGTVVAEQWASLGIHISAVNGTVGNPDKVLIFDSANPTGEDPDLQTPGFGTDNDEPFGNLLIIAEDDVDAGGDGLVDDPDDNRFGGTITLRFENAVDLCSATLIDVDSNEHVTIRGFDFFGTEVGNILVQALDDNSRQTIDFFMPQIMRATFEFEGSGGIGELGFVPCPNRIDFDSLIAGDPLGFPAGLEIAEQFSYLGIHFSADNADPTHPDKLILFDTANPTGGDGDLGTPGPGTNNDVPRGMVIIIAENDVDAGGDGLVDDPDDEALGGVITIVFDTPVIFERASVLDVELPGSFWRFYDSSNTLLLTVPLVGLGDNSVETIEPNQCCVSRAVLELNSSGAITDLLFCPQDQIGEQ